MTWSRTPLKSMNHDLIDSLFRAQLRRRPGTFRAAEAAIVIGP